MQRYINDFSDKLLGFDFKTIEDSKDVIFGLSKNLELIYFNESWREFYIANCEECQDILLKFPLGTPFENAILGDLKDYYKIQYAKVLTNLKVWKHEYECSSPNVFRVFLQSVYPLKNGAGLIVVNSLKIECKKSDCTSQIHNSIDYVHNTGLITQCSHCKRTQRVNDLEIWDWVPQFIVNMPSNTSHSICPICYDYHWKFFKANSQH